MHGGGVGYSILSIVLVMFEVPFDINALRNDVQTSIDSLCHLRRQVVYKDAVLYCNEGKHGHDEMRSDDGILMIGRHQQHDVEAVAYLLRR